MPLSGESASRPLLVETARPVEPLIVARALRATTRVLIGELAASRGLREVHDAVAVACEVGEHVPHGPPRQHRRRPHLVIGEVGDHLAQTLVSRPARRKIRAHRVERAPEVVDQLSQGQRAREDLLSREGRQRRARVGG